MSEENIVKNEEKATEVIGEKVEEEVVSDEETQPKTVENRRKNRRSIVKEKIEKSKTLTAETKSQIDACMKNIDADMEAYESQKQTLFKEALAPTETLLEAMGADKIESEEITDAKVELLDLSEDEVDIRELSSGRIKGFFWALAAGAVLVAGWCYWVSSSLGLRIPPEKIPDFERLNQMLGWTAGRLGQSSSANIGAAAVIVSALLLMWIVYALIVSVRTAANLKIASKTEEEVQYYCKSKEECREKMKLVREHIQHSTDLVKKYQVVLEEQNAKLKRARFFEEAKEIEGLHANTKEEVLKTQKLIAEIKALLAAPISEAGILTKSADETLKRANKSLNDHIVKIYL